MKALRVRASHGREGGFEICRGPCYYGRSCNWIGRVASSNAAVRGHLMPPRRPRLARSRTTLTQGHPGQGGIETGRPCHPSSRRLNGFALGVPVSHAKRPRDPLVAPRGLAAVTRNEETRLFRNPGRLYTVVPSVQ